MQGESGGKQGCYKLSLCRLRRRERGMKRGHLALRQRAVALCTPTRTRRLPDLATALDLIGPAGSLQEESYGVGVAPDGMSTSR